MCLSHFFSHLFYIATLGAFFIVYFLLRSVGIRTLTCKTGQDCRVGLHPVHKQCQRQHFGGILITSDSIVRHPWYDERNVDLLRPASVPLSVFLLPTVGICSTASSVFPQPTIGICSDGWPGNKTQWAACLK